MIYITALCSSCGARLKIRPDGPGDTGDLYLSIGADGQVSAQALCKNGPACTERQAAR